MDKLVVKIEKSGNRYNAFDIDGVKYTSDITTGARKKALTRIAFLPYYRVLWELKKEK